MWDKIIEFPDHDLELKEVADILKAWLDEYELKQFVEELLGWPSKGGEVLEPYNYELDV